MTEKIRNRAGNTIARACSGGEAASLRLRTAAAGPDCRSRKQRKAFPARGRGRRPRGCVCLPQPAGPDCRRRKRREASPTQGRAAAPCRAARHPPSAGAVAHGVGTAARRPPGPSPAWGWDCRPSPAGPDCRRRKRREASPPAGPGRRSRKQRKALFIARPGRRPCRAGTVAHPPAGPDCRSRKQRKALFYTRPGRRPCRAARQPPSAGAVAHGVGTAARRPPGPSPAWGWDCRPSPAGPDCRRRKRREASPAVRRGRCPRGWDCRPSPAGPDCRSRKRREAPPT